MFAVDDILVMSKSVSTVSHWVTAVISSICSNVQISKYLDLSNCSQISSKSLNLWLFCLTKVTISGQAVFCPNFISTLMAAKYPNILHTCSYIRWRIPTIHQSTSYFPGCLWESETQNANRTISLVKLLPKYPYICWKGEFGTIRMKNSYNTKLQKALPNRRQIRSKSEIWKEIFEHLNRYELQ